MLYNLYVNYIEWKLLNNKKTQHYKCSEVVDKIVFIFIQLMNLCNNNCLMFYREN